jgi:hypothetical protein
MTTVPAAETQPAETVESHVRPSPDAIDAIARIYLDAQASKKAATDKVAELEADLIQLVANWGVVPPHAEKSRRLKGNIAELTVTHSDVLTIVEERVDTLKEALEANGYGEWFGKLFKLRSKWEVVEGAEAALKAETLPKRLSEKVLNLWGRCITVKPKKPSLRVDMGEQPKKATRAKKVKP